MIDLTALSRRFETQHGVRPRLFRAPGRVNLIGEHTDYNEGVVLPMAIERDLVVAAAARADRTVVVQSAGFDAGVTFDLDSYQPPQPGAWVNSVRGMARMLEEAGAKLSGAHLMIESEIPSGAGLSSSAALEIGTGIALLSLVGQEMDPLTLAEAAQRAEHHFAGTRCGVMDPLVIALGQAGCALLVDCRALDATPMPLELPAASIVICDSKVKHDNAGSEYNQRRAECERAVHLLQAKDPAIAALRDVTPESLSDFSGILPALLLKRVRHVVEENERTWLSAQALKEGELAEFGRLMNASHRSLRDLYEVSCPELDFLVDKAQKVPGVLGSRMTGGGFGGCTVSLVRTEALPQFTEHLTRAYSSAFGKTPAFFVTKAADGAGELPS